MEAMMKLLPCPFCGGEVSIRGHFSHSGGVVINAKRERWNRWIISCRKCPISRYFHGPERDAIEEWNTRPTGQHDGERAARVEALEKAATECNDIGADAAVEVIDKLIGAEKVKDLTLKESHSNTLTGSLKAMRPQHEK